MSLKTTMLSATLLSTLLPLTASAVTQQVTIDLYSGVFQRRDTVPLKRMMSEQVGRHNIRGWSTKKVEVVAKSRQGRGSISLLANGRESSQQTVPGTPTGFDSNTSGFYTLVLRGSSSYGSSRGGPVRLLTQGNIKIDKIKVSLHKKLNYNYQDIRGARLSKVGEFKAHKIIGKSESYSVHGYLNAIKVVGTSRKVNIDEVKVHFSDGQVVTIDELNGRLRDGGAKTFSLRGVLDKQVSKVTVSASAGSLFGSRGKVAVYLAR